MLDTSRVAARLAEARTYADRIGLRVQLETHLAYLGRYAAPRRTRCTLRLSFEAHSFAFTMEAEATSGAWTFWFEGLLSFNVPHDMRSPGAFPAFATVVTPPLGWSVTPDPIAETRRPRRRA